MKDGMRGGGKCTGSESGKRWKVEADVSILVDSLVNSAFWMASLLRLDAAKYCRNERRLGSHRPPSLSHVQHLTKILVGLS